MMISLSGWLLHTTAASRFSILESVKDDLSAACFWCLRFSFSLATMCSGKRRWDQSVASSPDVLMSCKQTLIWVSTRDLAPVGGRPKTRMVHGLSILLELKPEKKKIKHTCQSGLCQGMLI